MKVELWQQLIAVIKKELEETENAARDAAAYATDDEAKAKSKWDTQGLEASYLAAGQAKKVGELRQDLARLQALGPEFEAQHTNIREASLVELENGSERDSYLIVPAGGGSEIKSSSGTEVWAITPLSPLGRSLIGKSTGDSIRLPNGSSATITTVC